MTCAHSEDLEQSGGRRRRSETECVEGPKGLLRARLGAHKTGLSPPVFLY